MFHHSRRFLMFISLLGSCLLTSMARAQFTYSDFSNVANLNFVDSAAQSGSRLRITPSSSATLGTVWYQQKQNVAAGFTTSFSFQYSNIGGSPDANGNPGTDGIAFDIQSVGNMVKGSTYGNPGLSIYFDAYDNIDQDDFGSSRVEIKYNTVRLAQANVEAYGIVYRDQAVHQAVVQFDGSVVSVSVDNQQVISNVAVNLNALSPGYVGFNGFTGDAYANQDVLNWSLSVNSGTLVTGSVTLENCDDPEQAITFEFRPKPGGTPFRRKQMLTKSGTNSGTFSLSNVPAGTYDIAIKGFCWLQKVLPNVVVNGNVSGLAATLSTADLNDDNMVDIADFGILVNEYGLAGDP